jgi:PleD family two-component response regulator
MGSHNRCYIESHPATLSVQASARGKKLALKMLDVD